MLILLAESMSYLSLLYLLGAAFFVVLLVGVMWGVSKARPQPEGDE